MGLFTNYVSAGLYFIENHTADLDAWSELMVRHFGKDVEKILKDIRQWSLLIAYMRAGPRPEKRNCWEFMRCGKEVHGLYAAELGVCPAALELRLDGMHGGKNGGRACWMMGGALCGGSAPSSFIRKRKVCHDCAFYRSVKDEEGDDYFLRDSLMLMLMR